MTGFTHESSRNETAEWYTPPSLFDSMGIQFDLDPCAPPVGSLWTVPATHKWTAEDDGRLMPWHGNVFCNPPYGQDTATWLEKLALHGRGVALVFARTDTKWFHRFAADADAICFIEGRIKFIKPDGSSGDTPGAGSMLVIYGDDNVQSIVTADIGLVMRGRGIASAQAVPENR